MKQIFLTFQVSKEDAFRIAEASHEPHTHDNEELIIGIEGKQDLFIGFKTSLIGAPLIS
ncbi:MAG: hypothetical protein JW801_11975 [Bacteroidales bacterium]|nr:hypothetical protein [Bacteroidales bacterium]